jgi:CBS domain-containing protein
MIAADIMTRAAATLSPETPLDEVIRLLLETRAESLPVVGEDGAVVGTVSETDLLRRAELGSEKRPTSWLGLFASDSARAAAFVRGHGKLARDVMTHPAATVAEDTPVGEVAALLEKRGIGRVPVVRNGRLVGVVGRSDLLRALASRLTPLPPRNAGDRELREAVIAAIEGSGWMEGAADMTIVVEGGVVQLWGSIADEAVHRALVLAIGDVPGVREVRDNLVRPPHPDPLDRPNWPVPAAP